MNRIERRVRNMINPYSTAFAGWWCHSGRYTRLARLIPGHAAVLASQAMEGGEGGLESP